MFVQETNNITSTADHDSDLGNYIDLNVKQVCPKSGSLEEGFYLFIYFCCCCFSQNLS